MRFNCSWMAAAISTGVIKNAGADQSFSIIINSLDRFEFDGVSSALIFDQLHELVH